jgi:uncharacterized protein YukE
MPISYDEFREFSNEVLSKLSSIDMKVDGINSETERLRDIVDGNGNDGLQKKVDRLEQTVKKNAWLKHTAIGAFISAVIYSLCDYWFRK